MLKSNYQWWRFLVELNCFQKGIFRRISRCIACGTKLFMRISMGPIFYSFLYLFLCATLFVGICLCICVFVDLFDEPHWAGGGLSWGRRILSGTSVAPFPSLGRVQSRPPWLPRTPETPPLIPLDPQEVPLNPLGHPWRSPRTPKRPLWPSLTP